MENGGGGGGGAYSVSNLHVKRWPGQLMGMRGIVRPMLLFPSPLHQYLLRFLGGRKRDITLNDDNLHLKSIWTRRAMYTAVYFRADCKPQPS